MKIPLQRIRNGESESKTAGLGEALTTHTLFAPTPTSPCREGGKEPSFRTGTGYRSFGLILLSRDTALVRSEDSFDLYSARSIFSLWIFPMGPACVEATVIGLEELCQRNFLLFQEPLAG
jgi:hypothetical protein